MFELERPYWTVDGRRFYNQFETWLAIGSGDPSRAHFNFFDEVYERLDWTKQPSESWDSLVHKRCLQLRLKYSHLCLLYSGGRDSHHILRSFAKFKIPIDEIIINDFVFNKFKHPEVDAWMMPLAQQYVKNHNANCKITRIIVGKDAYETYFNETWSEAKCMSGMRGQYQPGNHAWLVEKYLTSLTSGSGVIMGVDKPRLYYENGWIVNKFVDIIFDWATFPYSNFEFFYLSPELPELHVKQCHMIIDWWEQHMPGINESTIEDFIHNPAGQHYDNYNLACGRGPAVDLRFQGQNGLNKYSTSNHATFQIIQRTARANNWKSLQHWSETYAWIRSKVPQAFDPENLYGFENTNSRFIKPILGKSYKLGPWKIYQ